MKDTTAIRRALKKRGFKLDFIEQDIDDGFSYYVYGQGKVIYAQVLKNENGGTEVIVSRSDDGGFLFIETL